MNKIVAIIFISALMAGCLDSLQAKPLPPDKQPLAGCWETQDGTDFLQISLDGSGKYHGLTESIRAPLSFNGTVMSIGAFGFSKTFTIEAMPTTDHGKTQFKTDAGSFGKIDCTTAQSIN